MDTFTSAEHKSCQCAAEEMCSIAANTLAEAMHRQTCDPHSTQLLVQGVLAAEPPVLAQFLMLGATLAVGVGLPFLLLPASSLPSQPPQGQKGDDPYEKSGKPSAVNPNPPSSNTPSASSPFAAATAAASAHSQAQFSNDGSSSSNSGGQTNGWHQLLEPWQYVQHASAMLWSKVVSLLVMADTRLRTVCASSLLDTAVAGLIVVGLILGSVVLSAVLLVQIGDESRQVCRASCCALHCAFDQVAMQRIITLCF